MSLALRPRSELSEREAAALELALQAFYRDPPGHYYQIANHAAQRYDRHTTPFHCDLVEQVAQGFALLEIGCGTAHLCPYVEQQGGRYTGLDYSERLIAENRIRFPSARFFPLETTMTETFDIVASLYTIEHVVNPIAYLESMWNSCRPRGLLAVICPEFVEGEGFAPSIFYGRTPRRFREKLRSLSLFDASRHLVDLKVRMPLWKNRARKAPPGTFWINLYPAVLHGAPYGIDADAVHLPRLRDLVWFFERKGAAILRTSANMPGVSPEVLRYNCYVLAQKPASAAPGVRPGHEKFAACA